MRVIITGAHGQVGCSLVEKFQDQDKVELLATGRDELDITNQSAVDEIIEQFKPDYIINSAAYTAVDKAEEEIELSYAINHDGVAHLAKAANKMGAVLLHISTDYVFDGENEAAYEETSPTKPKCIYGKSKLAGELAIAEAMDKFLIVRTSWVFGTHGKNFVKTMLRLGTTHECLSVVGDQFGGPTYSDDIANALVEMVKFIENGNTPEWGCYHFSGEPHVSWYEFAKVIFNKARDKKIIDKLPNLSSINTSEYPTRASRPANSRLNCNKIKAQFNIEPSNWQVALNNIQEYK
ncbi:TPA: dTDP-4-dehydrorhamnose reductase [Yersinia enterocolitica]|uniref:dTDP-4-dehydrorhamnose reductase n=1 Tax=Yersinia enterocolitica TaxID=630 RepID=UPI001CA55CF4|nr:dTDP-4-dehydrorhamnose reductase [Yersinia enterocolitica]MBW5835044.1 dTDP-4-dehydrorhamnose reductase [Yersinia enterocolitica]HEI6851949.1 dTDP-4-dehydrorhamnose reductase [Yersinia enterocolitica]HEN3606116.1 dTDP-4-dehydrorhamnose reductase [Yersinia enterocolitica]HEN3610438.1 dTDP-4-dehydrorhamnose reductase [Yersinia enterocolitica]HEN3615023.1 dTDP-4-dehydrorhamnose reductase [Yersinia enterocolitica]